MLSSWVSSTAGSVSLRTWEFQDTDGVTHIIELTHDHMTGVRVLKMDDSVIYEATIFPDKSCELKFSYKGDVVVIKIIYNRSSIPFQLDFLFALNGKPLRRHMEGKPNGKTNFSLEEFTARVPNWEKKSEGEEESVWYTIKISPAPLAFLKQLGSEYTALHDKGDFIYSRRYRDFEAIHEQVVRSLRGDGDHLIRGLPSLPAMKVKSLTDHNSEAFCQERAMGLEVYLQKLMSVPRLSRLPALRRFLGFLQDPVLSPKPEVVELVVASVLSSPDSEYSPLRSQPSLLSSTWGGITSMFKTSPADPLANPPNPHQVKPPPEAQTKAADGVSTVDGLAAFLNVAPCSDAIAVSAPGSDDHSYNPYDEI